MIAIAIATLAVGGQVVSAAPGQLAALDKAGVPAGLCPLQGTKVDAEIAGFGARVHVVQTFVNTSQTPIEAIYTFPLPNDAAVDRMRIKVGSRVIEGQIKRREEARQFYEAARAAGQTAALLDQERPNVFTQSVANIVPRAVVQVEISYVQLLKYEAGEFEFNFPMVVGPRYTAGTKDASKVTPPVAGTRSGSTIDLKVLLSAGAPIQSVKSVLHQVNVARNGDDRALVTLKHKDEIPNRDFILRYTTATDSVQSAFITSYDGAKGGFFSLILLPPKAPKDQDISPREMIFVMDQSGSQDGFPIEKSKELTLKLIKTLRSGDTFNVYGFSDSVHSLFTTPRAVTPESLEDAVRFVSSMRAKGGTELLQALSAALAPEKDPNRLRLIIFNTDGFIGDEPPILDAIAKARGKARIFTFGIGNSVNRFLIDGMSAEGRGDSEIVTLEDSADAARDRLLQRTRSPILTDVSAKFEGIDIYDTLPRPLPDVFSDRPIVIMGRYANPGQGRVVLSGRLGGKPWTQSVDLRFPSERGLSCVSTLWARRKVDELQSRSYRTMLSHRATDSPAKQIVDLALEFGIMTQYTSFVAVEQRVVNVGGKSYPVQVPVDAADGVNPAAGGANRLAVFGGTSQFSRGAVNGMSIRSGGTGTGTGTATATGTGTGGGNAQLQGGQGLIGASVNYISYDARDNSLILKNQTPEERYKAVVDPTLQKAKGKVAIMVTLSFLDKKIVAALKKAGMRVDVLDQKIRIAFGTCDAAKLKALAQVAGLQSIKPLK